jgi:GR25 family glycosyltransferase involved in LPS biosynthesis
MTESVLHQYVDKVFYINLDIRPDRKETIETRLKEYGIEAERFPAIYHPTFGLVGCGLSHLAVLKLAKERGYKNVFILEDDFMFTVSKSDFEMSIKSLFSQDLAYDVYYVSYMNIEHKIEMPENPIVDRLISGNNASGYIVKDHYYQKLIDLYEYAMPLLESTGQHWIYANDQIWKHYQCIDQWYCTKYPLGKQESGFSNISNCFCER